MKKILKIAVNLAFCCVACGGAIVCSAQIPAAAEPNFKDYSAQVEEIKTLMLFSSSMCATTKTNIG